MYLLLKKIYIGSCYYLLFAVYSRTDRRVGSKNIACHPSIQYHTSIDLKLADGKGGGVHCLGRNTFFIKTTPILKCELWALGANLSV